MDNRRFFLAILLSVAILTLPQLLLPPAKRGAPPAPGRAVTGAPAAPKAGAAGGEAASSVPSAATGGNAVAARDAGAANAGAASGAAAGAAQAAATPGPVVPAGPAVQADREEQVALAAGPVRAVFTNRGAQLLSVTVAEENGRERLELVRGRQAGPYPYALAGPDLAPLPVNDALFAVTRSADGRSAAFRYRGPLGFAEKRFSLDANGLLGSELRYYGGRWGVLFGPGIRNPTAEELGSRYSQRDVAIKIGSDVEVVNPRDANESREISGRGLVWVAVEDTYFVDAAIPQTPVDKVLLRPVLVVPSPRGASFVPVPPKDRLTPDLKDLNREFVLELVPAGENLALASYWGSKRLERVQPYGLEDTVQLGRLGVVVRPLLVGLHWIYDHVVANYGWAIILMTILIKVLLLPLTHRSTISMRKMQTLNPKMQAIRDRYRGKLKDKQGRPNLEGQRKMNEEVMALYKAEGVNPAGGCLPLLLQMPILFAFYRLLSNSVELRHAPWMLWIQDLSVKDPYFVLPIIMGVTQFLQVYLGPQSGDPSQRRLFMLMPLFMLVFFLGAPSGLVLYWLTNNVLTIAQQTVYNRLWKNEGAA